MIEMDFTYERRINYYETDRMGIVHHSNYIRFLEEARCQMLDKAKMPYSSFEENGIMIPVLGVTCNFKHHVTFDDILNTIQNIASSFHLFVSLIHLLSYFFLL